MAGNIFGDLFRVSTFGESHGAVVGCVVDGCPAGVEICVEDVQEELDRRRPGQSDIVTPRDEADRVEILSGVFEGKTSGTPIMMMIRNKDQRSRDYSNVQDAYRPSHADYVYDAKYGFRDFRGGGRSSARETVGRVAAGAVAKKFLESVLEEYSCVSFVQQVGALKMVLDEDVLISREMVDSNIVRCPDAVMAAKMEKLIKEVKSDGDTIGGVVKCVVKGLPVGLGEPVFDRLNADLAKVMMSINAVKGFELGSGFAAVEMRGSEHNDEFYMDNSGRVRTRTNNSGGIQGGISNGEDVYFRVAFKPVATIMKAQKTVNSAGEEVDLKVSGRHDPCVVPRAVPIVDAMCNLVMADFYLRWRACKLT